MTSVLIFIISVVGFILAPVAGQQDILNVKMIEDGSPFTITCNAQRVITPSANFSYTSTLQIHVFSTRDQGYKMVAQYSAFGPVAYREIKEPPQGRNWKFNLNGSNSENGGANNQITMKIEIQVADGKCEDAGMYKCTMVYYSTNGAELTVFSEQNVSSTARTTEPLVVLDPIYEAPLGISNTSTYDLGANITITCRFEGPEKLEIKWKRERRPAIGIDVIFDDYSIANDITPDPTTKVPGTSTVCPQYSHKSVLRLTISQEDADRQYLCVVLSGDEEKARSAAFIKVGSDAIGPGGPGTGTGEGTGAASAGSKPDNIGLIVGVVVGVVVAIIIVVVIIVVVCRRRSKGANKNKDDVDSPDGGHNQPAPPPVLYSRPNKGVTNNNRDSKALDDDGRREPYNRQHDDVNYNSKEGKPYRYNPSDVDSTYTHEHKQTNGLSRRSKDDLHYASTDVSNEDEGGDQLVLPPGRNKSKPKPKTPPPVAPRPRGENKQLNYIQLDLAPSKNDGLENAGRRNRNVVEYAEISV